jgi:cellulose synthase (UDP-forming)
MVTTLQPNRGALMTASSANRTPTPRPPDRASHWQKPAVLVLVLLVVAAIGVRLGSLRALADLGATLIGDPTPASADFAAALLPAGVALLFGWLLQRLPRRSWSGALALLVLVLVCLRYLHWRLHTLDQGRSLALATGALMLLIEAAYLLQQGLWLLPAPLFDPARRRRQADQLQSEPLDPTPSVEFWVRTEDQEERLVRRALIACRHVDHPDVRVAVLDTAARPEVEEIARSLGMRYVALPAECRHGQAFAPLLAAALPDCEAELVALFDCRFMPFATFLKRTLGFFGDERVVMVQTPLTHFRSEFYNRNLGADQVMPGERDLFFHYGQVVLDRFNSVQACGGSSVVRRCTLAAMLAAPAGAARESTAVASLQRRGDRVVYLDEILSIGEAPHSFAAFLDQQLDQRRDQLAIIRAGGTLPKGHPFSPWPLLHQLGRTLAQLVPLLRIAFLLLPLFALLMGFPLIRASFREYLIFGAPMLVLLHIIPSWLTDHHHSRFWGEVLEALTAVPSLGVLLGSHRRLQDRPRGVPAGQESTVMLQSINLNMAWPFLLILVELITVLFLRYVLPLLPGFESLQSPGYTGETLSLLWNLHNGWVMVICLTCAIDQPVRRQGDRIPLRRSGRLELGGFSGGGVTCDLSETGAAFQLNPDVQPPEGDQGWLSLDDTALHLPVRVVRRDPVDRSLRMALRYEPLDAATTGSLLRLLYGGDDIALPVAHRIDALDAFRSLLGGIWGANPVVRRY